jgi:hypothetical protein
MVAAAGLTILVAPVFAQHGAGHASAGQITAARPTGFGRAVGTGHPIGPSRAMGISSGQRMGATRANPSFATTPTWEVPKIITPHWELGPNNPPADQNRLHGDGDRFSRHRDGFGVGFLGFPYYADPQAFVNADNGDYDNGDYTDQQAQPNAPAGPDNGQQTPSAEGGPYDEGYPPQRAPYAPQGYPPPPQNGGPSSAQSAAAQSSADQTDGLDHPAVTLVFNDGRQPMKVHSYALTGSSVFVAESGHQRVIPLTDLDLPATIAQNRDAGVDFELPSGGSR